MFVCEKNSHCIGCSYEYADKITDIDDEFASCEHLIEVAPVVHGRWLSYNSYNYGEPVQWGDESKTFPADSAFCSVCGEWLTASDEYLVTGLYCPNCGAKMDGKDGAE